MTLTQRIRTSKVMQNLPTTYNYSRLVYLVICFSNKGLRIKLYAVRKTTENLQQNLLATYVPSMFAVILTIVF